MPDVEPGDLGLVLAVHGFLHDVGQDYWFILCPENRLYRIPPELNQWAARIDADVRRHLLNLPKVFAFSSVDGKMTVRLLTLA